MEVCTVPQFLTTRRMQRSMLRAVLNEANASVEVSLIVDLLNVVGRDEMIEDHYDYRTDQVKSQLQKSVQMECFMTVKINTHYMRPKNLLLEKRLLFLIKVLPWNRLLIH